MKKIQKRVLDHIILRYKKNPRVLGILLFGSAAQGKFDQYSDIDIFILTDRKYKHWRENFMSGGVRFDVIINSRQRTLSDLERERYAVRRNFSHMLAYGSIEYDPKRKLEKIQSFAKHNLTLKTQYSKEEKLMHKYSIDDFYGEVQRYFEKKNWIAFALNSNLLINNIIELFLKIHGDYQRRPNEILRVLQRHDRKFAILFRSYCSSTSHSNQMLIINKLVKYIFLKTRGPLPRQWYT